MLRIDQIRLLPDEPEAQLPRRCARILRVPAEAIRACTVLRRAIDAREGLTFVYTLAVDVARKEGAVKPGDTVVITAGVPLGRSGSTNLIKAQIVDEEML